jgi:predicted HTH transcriptional regulator
VFGFYLFLSPKNLLLNTNHRLRNREMHVLFDNTQNDIENLSNDTVKFYHVSLISLKKRYRNITSNEISKELNQSLSTIKRKIKVLKEQGKIKRIGSDKNGFWEIVEII